jgi:dTMP kinase
LADKWVISDRFTDSTYAYQGAGRGLARETIRRIDAIVLDDFKPDLTLVLDLDVETGLKRAAARGGAESRFENFDRDFHERLRQAFLDIAKRNPDRCVTVDAAKDQDAVAAAIWAAVARRFGL